MSTHPAPVTVADTAGNEITLTLTAFADGTPAIIVGAAAYYASDVARHDGHDFEFALDIRGGRKLTREATRELTALAASAFAA